MKLLNVLDWKSKLRLFLDYALIAVVITLGGFTLALWAQKKTTDGELEHVKGALEVNKVKLGTLEVSLRNVRLENANQQKVIERLQEMRELDSKVIISLQTQLDTTVKTYKTHVDKLNKLGQEDEEVNRYLSTPIPKRLREHLREHEAFTSGSGTKDNLHNGTSFPSAAVPTTKPK